MPLFTSRPRLFVASLLAAGVLGLACFAGPARAEDPKPADPAKPADPKPAEPAKPGDPMPADPAKPGDPAKPADPAAAPVANVTLAEGLAELDRLEKILANRKADNADIMASMDSALKAYKGLVPTDDAGKATFEADKLKFMKEAEDLFLKAFTKVKVKANETNERDDVNVHAVQILAQTRPIVTKGIIDGLEKVVFEAKKMKYTPAGAVTEEAFKAIGLLNDHKVGLPYCIGWIKYDNTAGMPERIKSAFEALILFKDVKGDKRHEIVELTLRTFESTEHSADVNKSKEEQAQKRVWDVIRPAVIKCVQYYSKEPKAKDGALIATLKGFREWFKDHDKPKDEAWVDPKIVGTQKADKSEPPK